MSTSLLYNTQHIVGFQHRSYKYEQRSVIQRICRKTFSCDKCSSNKVSTFPAGTRRIHCGNIGRKLFFIELNVHRIYCRNCKTLFTEHLPFLSHPKSRISTSLERTVIELRSEMSISAIAEYFKLDWRTVKECEKHYLKKKFKTVRLKNVSVIGMDEIYIKSQGKEKYITIVRDLKSGAVLYVGDGKGTDSLKSFGKKLRHSKAKITAIAMDMSKAYISWVNKNLPGVMIVFDHFHVIKLMNDKVDKVRRRVSAGLDEQQKKLLKNQRFLFLRNVENLEPDAKLLLDNLRKIFKELGDVSMMKEALRSIYRMAKDDFQAEAAFKNWCSIAKKTEINELTAMAKTIENNLFGIIAYWKTDALSNAGMEGFNNKIRWLIRQAYGFKDKEYFTLKIYNLPNTKIEPVL
jgi:transposase